MNSRVVMVGVLALAAGMGCARENRWTLEDGGNGYEWSKAKSQPVMERAKSDVELVQANGIATLRNKASRRNVLVTIHAVPGDPMKKSTDFQVLVPAMSDVQIGRPGKFEDPVPTADKWTYSITKVAYK